MELIWGCGQGDGLRQIGTTGESGRLERGDLLMPKMAHAYRVFEERRMRPNRSGNVARAQDSSGDYATCARITCLLPKCLLETEVAHGNSYH
jgi:hypothetical protein